MDGISPLIVATLAGAALLGYLLGLAMPRRRGLAALLVGVIGFVAMAAQHLRLNGAPDDSTPFISYALFASVVGLIGAIFGSRSARKKV